MKDTLQSSFQEIEQLLPEIMERGQKYTPASAAEEFHQEYPDIYENFKRQYNEAYEFSGCGQRRSQINGFALILENLAKTKCLEKIVEDTIYYQKRT